MSKYDALGKFLEKQKLSIIPMTFTEIEKVVGTPLPRSSIYPAWWSNNSWNNVMTEVWLKAGFKTEQVNVTQRKLVFRRVSLTQPDLAPSAPLPKAGNPVPMTELPSSTFAEAPQPYTAATARHPIFGALKGLIKIVPGTDLTHPADPDWGNAS